MLIYDYTPGYYVEKKWLARILQNLAHINHVAIIRDDKEPAFPDRPYISIVTSTERHNYIPPETEDENCLGVFMNYAPIMGDSYQIDNFFKHPKIHNLPLGYHKEFNAPEYKDIPFLEDRPIDVCFWGQYDPYRRQAFRDACYEVESMNLKSDIVFYNGWNNGYGPQKYAECLKNSKIALVPWGSASRNTFRFWEAYYSGCVIICNAQYKTWYSDKINYFTCKDDWSDLEYWIDHIKKNIYWIDLHNSIEPLFTEKSVAKYIEGVICR